MSHYRLKTKYNTDVGNGETKEETLYADHNLSNDTVVFYDEAGEIIMTVPDTLENNLLDAINRLYNPFKNRFFFVDGVEPMDQSDCKKCKI